MAGDVIAPDHLRRQLCAGAGLGATSLILPRLVAAAHVVRASDFKIGTANPFQLKYDGYLINRLGTNRIASAMLKFSPNGNRYALSLTVDSFLADLHYQSDGRLDQFGLHPENYRERRKVPFRREKIRQVRYQETNDHAQVNRRREGTLIVPPNTQDRLSLLVHISLLAQANPALLEAGHDLAIPFARTSQVDFSRWRIGERQKAPATARGRDRDDDADPPVQKVSRAAQAQRIERRRPKDSKKLGVAFWLTNNASRLPMVLEFAEKGRVLKFVWRR